MLKLLNHYLIGKGVRRHQAEAEKIERLSLAMKGIPTASLANNFQNLRGREDREAMQIAFAIIVEMSDRTLKMRPYMVQIMGALAMSDGNIAEMATGEGKTLTAALPLAWHGLQKRSHAMTVNDYLAKRDALHLDPLYESLGLSCGYLQDDMGREARQLAYQSSILYGTSTQFVFDYLRDNIVYNRNELMQQERDFILIDEADSILIDEARTPMVLSSEGEHSSILWGTIRDMVGLLSHERISEDNRAKIERMLDGSISINADIAIDVKNQDAFITDPGIEKIEKLLIENGMISNTKELWQPSRSYIWRAISATVKALHVYVKDRDYIVRDDKVIIVDQETGRLSHGKRWNDGLHQAVESKERVEINPETLEVGRIALANYMSIYKKVSGMTGTAMTVADEIGDLYGLNVVPIPTHKPQIRNDLPDLVFMSRSAKWKQLVNDVVKIHETGQPILIGTASVEDSELLSSMFDAQGIRHRILNAKQDEAEASIIAQAGRLGAITIATSMAGRGTDILLGGNPDFLEEGATPDSVVEMRNNVVEAGGLFVIGAERLDSKRLDLQLAGRAGRQGDPGSCRFYIALDDPLMLNFGGETIRNIFLSIGVPEEDGIEHPMVDSAIFNAQKKRQSAYMDSRKNGLKQDGVIDAPRRVVYAFRENVLNLDSEQAVELIKEQVEPAILQLCNAYCSNFEGYEESWDIESFALKFEQWGLSKEWFDKLYRVNSLTPAGRFDPAAFKEELCKWLSFDLNSRIKQLINSDENSTRICQLMAIDHLWRGFLDDSERIRTAIHLRAYANEKPELALKKEVFRLFKALYQDIPVALLDFVYAAICQVEQELELKEGAMLDEQPA